MTLSIFLTGIKVCAVADTASSACLMNAVTGELVYEKNSHTKMPMASTTKIMTLLVALEHCDVEGYMTIPKEATLTEGSSAYLKPNAKIKIIDLLYGLMLNSGNDAAIAIAYHVSGNTADFAKLMTDTALKLGAKDTQFKNPNGLEAEGHYTTAYDLALITRYALKNPVFKEIVSAKTYTGKMLFEDGSVEEVMYVNHNRLLKELDGCIGVKTGFTKAAGRCLVSATERDGARYIVVTLNDSNDWDTHKELHNMAFESRIKKNLLSRGDCIKHMVSDTDSCELVATRDCDVWVNNEKGNKFEIIVHLPEDIDFSVNKNEKVGYLDVVLNGEVIDTIDIAAEKDFVVNESTEIKNCFLFTFLTLLRNII